jgi:hypothetical protein
MPGSVLVESDRHVAITGTFPTNGDWKGPFRATLGQSTST